MPAKKGRSRELNEVTLGNLTVNFDHFGVYVNDVSVPVTLKEFEILRVLLENPDKVLPYSRFAESLWPEPTERSRRNLSVLVHSLRRKLADSCPFVIKTIRSRGYGLIRDRASTGEIAWRPG